MERTDEDPSPPAADAAAGLVPEPGSPAAGAPPGEPEAATKRRLQATFLRAPLYFEANRGQTDAQVQYLARGPGYTLFLTATEAVLVLQQPPHPCPLPRSRGEGLSRGALSTLSPRPKSPPPAVGEGEGGGAILRLQLLGANPTPRVEGLEPFPGKVHYFRGNDPTKWRTNIPTSAKVKYASVYPGVDLIYYGHQR